MTTSNDIQEVLGVGRHNGDRRWPRWGLVAVLVISLVMLGYWWFVPAGSQDYRFETAEVSQGDLTVTVTATGTVQPVNQVDVGSELSGTIETVDVDFNDRVQRGQILARLDKDRLQAKVIETRAALDSNKAKLEEAKATVLETKLRHERCKRLYKRDLCTREDLDTTRAASQRALAAEASARAQVQVATATLEAHTTDLAKADIRSPIDGIVLRRQIEPGQTVAASLQAPVLFILAEDLAKMELLVAVDEADVGKIAEGQAAEFTVDAYPERSFPATITQVRYAPQTVEGVVTYETVLQVDNSDLALRPGMTATAIVTVQQLSNVLLVPNAALRFTPPTVKKSRRTGVGLFGRLFRRPRTEKRRLDTRAAAGQQVWIVRDGQPVAIKIKIGASDGKYTQLRAGELKVGQEVIIDAVSTKK